jgi:hypothetical protein
MSEGDSRGILRTNGIVWTEKHIENALGIRPKFVQELLQKGVMKRAPRSGVFYSKRMLLDELKRQRYARNGRSGGKAPKQNGSKVKAKGEAKPKRKSLSSSSSSEVIYNTYAARIRAGAKQDALKSIAKRIDEHGEAVLMLCIERYAADVAKLKTEMQFRIQPNNFFGERARFKEFLNRPESAVPEVHTDYGAPWEDAR